MHEAGGDLRLVHQGIRHYGFVEGRDAVRRAGKRGRECLAALFTKKAGREPVGAHAVRGALLGRRKTAVPFSRDT
jgi:hypothetical protein